MIIRTIRQKLQMSLSSSNVQQPKSWGQVSIEFSFALIVVVLMMYGMMRAFRWVGLDLAARRQAHDDTLVQNVLEDWAPLQKDAKGPPVQLKDHYHKPARMGLVFNQW